jgi:MHS family proline/betaine transporter-like MFS transporter
MLSSSRIGPRTNMGARTVIAVAIGNMMEWYDFALTAFLAQYLAPAFFPHSTPMSGLLNVLVVFGIAFVFRPLGGWLLGPLGDRKGRMFALVLAFGMMAVATACVGLMPPEASIGAAAPILLVLARIVQGVSAGGEAGLSVTYLMEQAPLHRRAFFTSFQQASSIGGFLFATLVVGLSTAFIGSAEMAAWGWRVPFLLAVPFGLIGLYIRGKLQETPDFEALTQSGQVTATPIRTAFRSNGPMILRVAAISAFQNVGYYTAYAYFPGHVQRLGYSPGAVTLASTFTLLIAMVTVPAFGLLADLVGRRAVLSVASGAALLLAIPLFVLMGSIGFAGVIACQVLLALTVAAYNSTTGTTYAEGMDAQTRAGSVSIGYSIGTIIFASPTLYVMTLINSTIAASWAPGVYMAVAALISLVAVLTMPKAKVPAAVVAV